LERRIAALEAENKKTKDALVDEAVKKVIAELTPMMEGQDHAIEAMHKELKPLSYIKTLVKWATDNE
jgi:hypothetical protein